MTEAVCSPSPCSQRPFRCGPKPGSCLTRAQHHSQNSSKISWKAPCAAFLQPFHLLPHSPSFHRPQLLHHELLLSLHAQPGDAMSLKAFVLAAGAFSAASHPAMALPAPAHVCNCRSILHPPSESGPPGTRHGTEACEDMVSCLREIPSPETRACRVKHRCKWHSEPREARL